MDGQRKARAPRLLGAILALGMLGALVLPVSPASAQVFAEVDCPSNVAVIVVDIDPGPAEVLATVTCGPLVTVTPLSLLPICVFVNVNVPGVVVTTTTVAVGTGCPVYPLNASNTQVAGDSAVNASASPGSPSGGAPGWLVVTAALGLLVAVNAGFVGGIVRRRRLTRTI